MQKYVNVSVRKGSSPQHPKLYAVYVGDVLMEDSVTTCHSAAVENCNKLAAFLSQSKDWKFEDGKLLFLQ